MRSEIEIARMAMEFESDREVALKQRDLSTMLTAAACAAVLRWVLGHEMTEEEFYRKTPVQAPHE